MVGFYMIGNSDIKELNLIQSCFSLAQSSLTNDLRFTEVYLEPCQTFRMKCFVEIVPSFKVVEYFCKTHLMFDKALNMAQPYLFITCHTLS